MNKTVTIVFSKDRPLQLHLCLKTYFEKCVGHENTDVYVLCKATNDRHYKAYQKLQLEFTKIFIIYEANFKTDLLRLIEGYENVLFVVDDNVFVKDFNINEIITSIQSDQVFGFSLRLGKNTTYCYSHDSNQKVPEMFAGKIPGIYGYEWYGKDLDFGYALELSSSVYKVKDIWKILLRGQYQGPNFLEWTMYLSVANYMHIKYLLCYETSAAFCNPINKVQDVNNNRAMVDNCYSPENLLKLFEEGYRIDPKIFYGFVSNACHQEVRFLDERTVG